MSKPATGWKLVALSCLLLLAPLIRPDRALAWGDKGHLIVARIAAQLLSPAARHQVAELLEEGETLESVAVWADSLRGSFKTPGVRPETPMWHFVDIPLKEEYDAARDCPETPNGSCVVSAMVIFQDALTEIRKGYYGNSRYEALKFLVHFVGDAHQPLHCVDDHDAGGNLKTVVWIDGSISKLHGVWDDGILSENMKRQNVSDPRQYADRLIAQLSPQQKQDANPSASPKPTVVPRATIEGWAKAAHAIAQKAYADIGQPDANGRFHLNAAYYNNHKAEVDDQLKRAGARLARILNENLR
jgi:nuclease S1